MQLKTLSAWKKKNKGIRAGTLAARVDPHSARSMHGREKLLDLGVARLTWHAVPLRSAAVRAGMLLRGDSWDTTGVETVGEMSEAERLALEAEQREAEEQERRRLEEEAMAKRWAEKEQALKDAMLQEEQRRLAEQRRL